MGDRSVGNSANRRRSPSPPRNILGQKEIRYRVTTSFTVSGTTMLAKTHPPTTTCLKSRKKTMLRRGKSKSIFSLRMGPIPQADPISIIPIVDDKQFPSARSI